MANTYKALTLLALIIAPLALTAPAYSVEGLQPPTTYMASSPTKPLLADIVSGSLWQYLTGMEIKPKPLYNPSELPSEIQGVRGLLALGRQQPLQTGGETGQAAIEFTRNKPVTLDFEEPYENEPSIAANPNNPNNLVVAAHHYGFRSILVGAYASFDGGETWTGPVFMPLANETMDFGESDPALAAGPSGSFYLAYMSIGSREFNISGIPVRIFLSSDIMVAVSRDGGLTWNATVAASPDVEFLASLIQRGYYFIYLYLLDKEYIAAGPSIYQGNETVVVAYLQGIEGYGPQGYFSNLTIMAVVSHDGGRTWSKPVPISKTYNAAETGEVVQGAMPLVASNGTIFVAYYYSGEDGFLQGSAEIRVVRSDDGGKTWSKPVTAAIIPYEISYYAPPFAFRWSASMFPSMDMDSNGTIYISFVADPDGGGDDPSDVFLVYSRDWGRTWSEPVRVNDDEPGAGQFFSWLSVDPNGVVHIIWGDMRRAPGNIAYDVFYATFTPEEGVSPNIMVTDYPTFSLYWGFIGDYFNVVATGENVHAVWTDGRSLFKREGNVLFIGADQTIYTAKIGERPEPKISISKSTLPVSGYSIVEVNGSDLPVNAAYGLLLEDLVPLWAPMFSDENGSLREVVVVTPFSEGEYKISLTDYPAAIGEYGSVMVQYVDTARKAIVEESQAIRGALESSTQVLLNATAKLDNLLGNASVTLSLIKDSLGDVKVLISTGIDTLEGRIVDVGNDVLTVKTSLGELRLSLSSLAVNMTELMSRASAIESSLSGLSSRVDIVSGDLKTALSMLGDVSTGINDVRNTLGDVRATLVNVGSGVDTLRSLVEGQVIRELKLITTSTNDIKAIIDTGFSTIEGRLVELTDKTAVIETDLGTLKVNLDTLQVSIKDLGDKASSIESKIDEVSRKTGDVGDSVQKAVNYALASLILSIIILLTVIYLIIRK